MSLPTKTQAPLNLVTQIRAQLAAKQEKLAASKAASAKVAGEAAPGVDSLPGSEHLSPVPAGLSAADPGAHAALPAGARSSAGASDGSKVTQVGVPAGTPIATPKERPAVGSDIEDAKLAESPMGRLHKTLAAGALALKQASESMGSISMPAANVVGDTKKPDAKSPEPLPAGTPVAAKVEERPAVGADIKSATPIIADAELYRKLAHAMLATEEGRAFVDQNLLLLVGQTKAAAALAAIEQDSAEEFDKYAAAFSGDHDLDKLGQAMADEAMLGELAGDQPVDTMGQEQLDMLGGAEQLGAEQSISPEQAQQLVAMLIQAMQAGDAGDAGGGVGGSDGAPAVGGLPGLPPEMPAAPEASAPPVSEPAAPAPEPAPKEKAPPPDESAAPSAAKATEGTDSDKK